MRTKRCSIAQRSNVIIDSLSALLTRLNMQTQFGPFLKFSQSTFHKNVSKQNVSVIRNGDVVTGKLQRNKFLFNYLYVHFLIISLVGSVFKPNIL